MMKNKIYALKILLLSYLLTTTPAFGQDEAEDESLDPAKACVPGHTHAGMASAEADPAMILYTEIAELFTKMGKSLNEGNRAQFDLFIEKMGEKERELRRILRTLDEQLGQKRLTLQGFIAGLSPAEIIKQSQELIALQQHRDIIKKNYDLMEMTYFRLLRLFETGDYEHIAGPASSSRVEIQRVIEHIKQGIADINLDKKRQEETHKKEEELAAEFQLKQTQAREKSIKLVKEFSFGAILSDMEVQQLLLNAVTPAQLVDAKAEEMRAGWQAASERKVALMAELGGAKLDHAAKVLALQERGSSEVTLREIQESVERLQQLQQMVEVADQDRKKNRDAYEDFLTNTEDYISDLVVDLHLDPKSKHAVEREKANYDIDVILNFMGGKDAADVEAVASHFGLQQYQEARKRKNSSRRSYRINVMDPAELEDPNSPAAKALAKLKLTSRSRIMIIGHGTPGSDTIASHTEDGRVSKSYSADKITQFMAQNQAEAFKKPAADGRMLKISLGSCSSGLNGLDDLRQVISEDSSFAAQIYLGLEKRGIISTVGARNGVVFANTPRQVAPAYSFSWEEYQRLKQSMREIADRIFAERGLVAYNEFYAAAPVARAMNAVTTHENQQARVTMQRGPDGRMIQVIGRKDRRNDGRRLEEKELEAMQVEYNNYELGIIYNYQKNLIDLNKRLASAANAQDRDKAQKNIDILTENKDLTLGFYRRELDNRRREIVEKYHLLALPLAERRRLAQRNIADLHLAKQAQLANKERLELEEQDVDQVIVRLETENKILEPVSGEVTEEAHIQFTRQSKNSKERRKVQIELAKIERKVGFYQNLQSLPEFADSAAAHGSSTAVAEAKAKSKVRSDLEEQRQGHEEQWQKLELELDTLHELDKKLQQEQQELYAERLAFEAVGGRAFGPDGQVAPEYLTLFNKIDESRRAIRENNRNMTTKFGEQMTVEFSIENLTKQLWDLESSESASHTLADAGSSAGSARTATEAVPAPRSFYDVQVNGAPVRMLKFSMPGDNSCGFHALGIRRADAVAAIVDVLTMAPNPGHPHAAAIIAKQKSVKMALKLEACLFKHGGSQAVCNELLTTQPLESVLTLDDYINYARTKLADPNEWLTTGESGLGTMAAVSIAMGINIRLWQTYRNGTINQSRGPLIMQGNPASAEFNDVVLTNMRMFGDLNHYDRLVPDSAEAALRAAEEYERNPRR